MKHWKFHVWIDRQLGMFTVDIFEIVERLLKYMILLFYLIALISILKLKIITSMNGKELFYIITVPFR